MAPRSTKRGGLLRGKGGERGIAESDTGVEGLAPGRLRPGMCEQAMYENWDKQEPADSQQRIRLWNANGRIQIRGFLCEGL